MNYEQHTLAVQREAAEVVTALRAGSLDVKVPTCPEWTLVELATHIGQFCALWTHVLCEDTGRAKTPYDEPSPSERGAEWFAAWVEDNAGYLTEILGSVRGDTPAWTWSATDNTAGFIARRAAHELAVHRFDVQSARSGPSPIDGPLAVDGIEEIFTMIEAWRTLGEDVGAGLGETLHLHASEPEAEWTLTLAPEGLVVERSHRKADLALRGSASDLELVLYDRPPIGEVQHLGADTALEAWRRAFHFN